MVKPAGTWKWAGIYEKQVVGRIAKDEFVEQ